MQKELCDVLKENKSVAVVGLSKNPAKTSRQIADYLIENNFKVVGVNPTTSDIDGYEVYKSISDIPFKVDIINVFRKSEDIPELIEATLEHSPKVFWLQLGIRNDEAVKPFLEAGIEVVQDTCIKVAHMYCD